MPEPIDLQTDPQTLALLALTAGAVRDEVHADVVNTLYGHPIPLSIVPRIALPALAIWRRSETRKAHSSNKRHRRVLWRFDYIASDTSLDRLGVRWPALQVVWKHLLAAVEAGRHAAVSAGADVLNDAGIEWLDPESPRVEYAFAPNGKKAYPGFQATMTLEHRHPLSTASLVDASCLRGLINLDGLEVGEQPLVSFQADTP